ncbi:unnamed protein product [Effrenium voratum]|nr:unnamed protein product [Effrenium voratum]
MAQGSAQLQELLRRPPAEVAQWVVQQAQSLSDPAAQVESLPIFQVAGALSAASTDQKQELMKSAISGFGKLPAGERAEVLRLAVSATVQAGGSGTASSNAGPLTRNVGLLVKEAKIDEMPAEERKQLAQEVQKDASELVQPQQLIEVVAELKPEEREQVTEALIEAKIVPKEQQAVLEQAMRPGGYADKLAAVVKVWMMIEEYAYVILAFPFLELFLAMIFGGLPCNSGLSTWLRADAIYGVLTVSSGWCSSLQLAPVLQRMREDPVDVAQRWQETEGKNLSLTQRLEHLVPGVDVSAYQLGALGVAAATLFLIIGLANSIVGILELFATLVAGCSVLMVLVSMVFLAVRCATLVGILVAAQHVLVELQAAGVVGADGYASDEALLRGDNFNRAPLHP